MLKIISRLGDIPVGSTVTKIGGQKEYVVRDRVDIYTEGGVAQRIYADDCCLYLTGSEGYINAHGFEKELVWHTELDVLVRLSEEE